MTISSDIVVPYGFNPVIGEPFIIIFPLYELLYVNQLNIAEILLKFPWAVPELYFNGKLASTSHAYFLTSRTVSVEVGAGPILEMYLILT